MLWSRKSTPIHERNRHAGLDITSSRIVGVSMGSGKARPLLLDDPREELPLFIALDQRNPVIGPAGYAQCRKLPHAVCSNFLPALGQPRDWRMGRNQLTPESALELAFLKILEPVLGESNTAVLALPSYLQPGQVARVIAAATRTRFPLKGTVVGPLALVAMRAAQVSSGKPIPTDTPPDGVLRLHSASEGPGAVVVIDADEFALSAIVAVIERDRVRLIAASHWPRFSRKTWKERLLEAVADRCVRLCRRDPRDSADAEQSLYEQLDEAMEKAHSGQRTNLTVRTSHWFQDVIQQPDDLAEHCAALARGTAEAVRELVGGAGLAIPPRKIWLTHEASRLPGLRSALHLNSHEATTLEVLPRDALALAAAMLVPRWLAAELPLAHLDSAIPLAPAVRPELPAEKPRSGRR